MSGAVPAVTTPQVIVFDVNETLSDLSGLRSRFTDVGAAPDAAATWFAATLRDGFALAVMGESARFADIARSVLLGLFSGMPELNTGPSSAADHVLAGFAELSLHPDVADGVRSLAEAGCRLVTLSNGAASVAQGLLARAGIADHFEQVLTVEDAGVWKPHPRAYRYVVDRCAVPAADSMLVAVHPWDLHGADRAGLRTAFLDRTGAPWPSVFAPPGHRIRALPELATDLLGRG